MLAHISALTSFCLHELQDIDKEISELKLSVNTRGRLVATEFLKQFIWLGLSSSQCWLSRPVTKLLFCSSLSFFVLLRFFGWAGAPVNALRKMHSWLWTTWSAADNCSIRTHMANCNCSCEQILCVFLSLGRRADVDCIVPLGTKP